MQEDEKITFRNDADQLELTFWKELSSKDGTMEIDIDRDYDDCFIIHIDLKDVARLKDFLQEIIDEDRPTMRFKKGDIVKSTKDADVIREITDVYFASYEWKYEFSDRRYDSINSMDPLFDFFELI